MSYHIIHILTHKTSLHIDRGCLVCKIPPDKERHIPLQDTLGLIIAARGVHFSGECLSTLIKNNVFILHCDDTYKPIGKSIGLGHIIHTKVVEQQLRMDKDLNLKIWQAILEAKVTNQIALLDSYNIPHSLNNILENKPINESYASRIYWKEYFPLFNDKAPKIREHRDAQNKINKMLNYGYAVIGAIIHRSIIAHGLLSVIGIHHKIGFKSDPLVYDLMEPLRPFVEYILLKSFMEKPNLTINNWTKEFATYLIDYSVKLPFDKTTKILYAIDKYVESVANLFYYGVLDLLYIPKLDICQNQKER